MSYLPGITVKHFDNISLSVGTPPPPNQTVEEWRIVFFLAAGIYVAGASFYLLFASGRVEPWAEVQLPYVTHLDDTSEQGQQEVDEAEDEKLKR